MLFNLDIAIVLAFLLITLAVGLGHGQKVKNIKDYALVGRNFSTGALVATVVATYTSGSGFFITLSKTYSDGFYYMFASFGTGIYFLITALIFIPRMSEFLGKVSIAEAMGDIYGKKAFLISGVTLVFIKIIIAWIPFLMSKVHPGEDPKYLLSYIVDNYSFTGLKGFVLVAIIAFAMSTADSRINSSSVLLTHDVYIFSG